MIKMESLVHVAFIPMKINEEITMNKKGFAISVIIYSLVLVITSLLYMTLGVIKNRYDNEKKLRDNIEERLNSDEFVNK